jgi:hypothetical protein
VRAVLARSDGSGYQLVIGNRSLPLDAVDVFNPDYLLKAEWTWNVKLTAQGQIRAEPVPVPKQCREQKKGPPKLGTVNGNA